MMMEKEMFSKLNKLNSAKSTKKSSLEELRKQLGDTDKEIYIEKGHIIDKLCTDKGYEFEDVCRFLYMMDIPLDDATVLIERHTKMRAHTERTDTDEQ